MSSEVDICNISLSHLGDTATVASLYPPEGSAQSEHCARFYPIARDALLEMHNWSFATRRAPLALLTATNAQWLYVYAMPNNVIKALAVLPADADDDYSSTLQGSDWYEVPLVGAYTPQRYSIETLSTGQQVICTNQEDAVLRYTVVVTDPAKFSSLFTLSLSWLLASMLAGPIIKGEQGAAEGKRCYQMLTGFLGKASTSDAQQRDIKPQQVVSWMAGR